MAGDSTQTTPTSNLQNKGPWSAVAPYVSKGYEEAAKLYSQGPAKPTPWSGVTPLTDAQNQSITGTRNYVNSQGLRDFLNAGSNTVNTLVSGGNNPYANLAGGASSNIAGYLNNNNMMDPSAGINRMMYNTTNDPTLLNAASRGASATGSSFDAIRNQLQMPGISQSLADKSRMATTGSNLANTLSSAYTDQNTARMAAADLANKLNQSRLSTSASVLGNANTFGQNAVDLGSRYANPILNTPVAMLGALNDVGGRLQAQNQSNITDATNRWNTAQNAPYENLIRFRNLINPSSDWGVSATTGTQTTNTPGNGSGIGSMIGTLGGAGVGFLLGGPMGAMLGSSLGGTAGGGIGGMFH